MVCDGEGVIQDELTLKLCECGEGGEGGEGGERCEGGEGEGGEGEGGELTLKLCERCEGGDTGHVAGVGAGRHVSEWGETAWAIVAHIAV